MDVEIDKVIDIAKKAGKATLDVYEKDFSVDYKEDESPLTEADKASDSLIREGLSSLYPSIPLLSEEGKEMPYFERKEWKRFWLIDPLDGTKEFIKKNGEFTVNIALICEGKPVLGVVYAPVDDVLYYGYEEGSFRRKKGKDEKLPMSFDKDKMIVVASRSHFNDETKKFIESMGKDYELVSRGSSLKLCAVAEGSADIYPRLGPTMEWDTGAAHAVCRFAGKNVVRFEDGGELEYNKENLLNPWFVVK